MNKTGIEQPEVCTKEAPDKRFRIHPDARECGDQSNGYPGGDLVTMECPNCGLLWTRELPQ